MTKRISRRDMLGHTVRGAVVLGLGGTAGLLIRKADGQVVWQLDAARCLNSCAGDVGVPVCGVCTSQCVIAQSAVRAVNDHAKCGRCYICPAYYNVTSAVDDEGLPSEKLCPRDAITRAPIGDVDPEDPANNYYEYTIDEAKCDGCGKCVMACKEPAGLGSIRLAIRHDLCVDCNYCSIAQACPRDAFDQLPARRGRAPGDVAAEA
jgi:electron transport complex protein RnfB